MANKNIAESLRKPRRTKGTPFFSQRNYYAAGFLAFGAINWIFLEWWSLGRDLKKHQLEGTSIFTPNPEIEERFNQARLATSDQALDSLVTKLRARQEAAEDAKIFKEEQGRPQPCPDERISKYFKKVTTKHSVESKASLLSPYKDCLSEIQPTNNLLDNSHQDDFKSPQPIRKESKIKQVVKKSENVNSRKTRNRTTKSSQPHIRKFIEENFKHDDVNPDHLQMALALSESSYQAENPRCSSEDKNEKNVLFRKALEKFGFRYGDKNKLSSEFCRRKNPITVAKSKNSRYKFVTPILYLRTQEDRDALISSKTSLILNKQGPTKSPESNPETPLRSEDLQKNHNSARRIFNLNHLTADNLCRFQVPNLGVQVFKSDCRCLLKDWAKIAGRDFSPQRSVTTVVSNLDTEQVNDSLLTYNKMFDGSMSPDLFDYSEDPIENDVISPTQHDDKKKCSTESGFVSKVNTVDEDFFSDDCDRIPVSQNVTPRANKSTRQSCGKSPPRKKISYNLSSDEDDILDKSVYEEVMDYLTPCAFTLSPTKSPQSQLEISGLNVDVPAAIELVDKSGVDFNNESTGLNVDFELNKPVVDFNSENTKESNANTIIINESFKNCFGTTESGENLSQSQESCSQEESIVISDDELNYSCNFNHLNQNSISLSDSDEDKELHNSDDSFDALINKNTIFNKSPLKNQAKPPQISVTTPKNDDNLIIKNHDVTPMANYHEMNTPTITKELEKYGVKPLKRRRGAQLLQHIYDSTHPVIESLEDQIDNKSKRVRLDNNRNSQDLGGGNENSIVGDLAEPSENWIFERKSRFRKVQSCQVPLHIIWHNFIHANPGIHENVLLYEPLELEILHVMIKEQTGCRFNIQDLLTFLDRKCITIRTQQAQRKQKK